MPPLSSFGAHLPAPPPARLPSRAAASRPAAGQLSAAGQLGAAGQLSTTPAAAGQVRVSNQWWYGEDVAGNGKPGWIADTPGAALAFTVREM